MKGEERKRGWGTFCLLLRPGLVGVEVGECLEIGVDSWLLEPVPLAGRANTEVKRLGRKTKRDEGGGGGEGKEVEEVNSRVD